MSGGGGQILSSAEGEWDRTEGPDGEKTPGWKDEAERRRNVISKNSDVY